MIGELEAKESTCAIFHSRELACEERGLRLARFYFKYALNKDGMKRALILGETFCIAIVLAKGACVF
jgi:hypothetical protein